MTIENKVLLAGLAVMLLSVPFSAEAAQANIEADSFAVTEVDGNISFSALDSGSVTVTMPGKSSPMVRPSSGNVLADEESSNGAFVGNYTDADVMEVAVKITAATDMEQPSEVTLFLLGASGRMWRNSNIQPETINGSETDVSMLLERAAGWDWNGSGDKDALWAEDLKNVSYLGLTFTQRGDNLQVYTVSSLQLLDTSNSALAERVQAYFSAALEELSDEQKNGDDDGDGMTNWDEIRAGTNPGDANSVFAAELDNEQPAEGIMVSWPCVTGGTYSVLRADDTTFNFTVKAYGLTPSEADLESGVMSYTDDSAVGDGPYFFKIVIE